MTTQGCSRTLGRTCGSGRTGFAKQLTGWSLRWGYGVFIQSCEREGVFIQSCERQEATYIKVQSNPLGRVEVGAVSGVGGFCSTGRKRKCEKPSQLTLFSFVFFCPQTLLKMLLS